MSDTKKATELVLQGETVKFTGEVFQQLSPDTLAQHTLDRHLGVLNDKGALCINTGKFTGRSPKDRFIVKDEITEGTIDWGGFNMPIEESHFLSLKEKIFAHIAQLPEVWVRQSTACADQSHRINITVVNDTPWSNLFAYNMFLRPTEEELKNPKEGWLIVQAVGFKADPKIDGTRQDNFAILSFKHKTIIIGGSGYTGEMKKGIFSALNFLLPHNENVLGMHCSTNMGKNGDVAVFFGLSGTGKTTLSADPDRILIGDDEHGWSEDGVFNFEGGCYAKVIDLSEEKEPEIYHAIRPGALVENVGFVADTNVIDFANKTITENTRVSYPLHYIQNAYDGEKVPAPQNIFFLTCDAYGVLPPVSKLNPEQAMYQFISGYTAKVAGTETGVTEPKSTFSACFGAPFMPLHPGFYAKMLGEKIEKTGAHVWLVNTGWIGGAYGVGHRISLKYTRAIITAALNGSLKEVGFEEHPTFKVLIPKSCPGVPSDILNPENTWADKKAYEAAANKLAKEFHDNFAHFSSGVKKEVLDAEPLFHD